MRRVHVVMVAAVAAMGLFGASCSSSSNASNEESSTTAKQGGQSTVVPVDEGTPIDGGQLIFGIDADPDNLDPLTAQWAGQGHLVASSMIEALVAFDADNNPVPFLAESIEPSDLASTWTIKVRPDITFHDGAPLDAEAVKDNLEAQMKGIASIGLSAIESIDVEDEMTVIVQMKQPWASFPAILAGSPGYIVSPDTLGTPEAANHPVGTGPFVFDSWDRDTSLRVTKNPNYWQQGKPHLDSIDFRIITDPNSRTSALAAGDLDMITTDQPKTIADYRSQPDFRAIIDASGDAESIFFNEAAAPFDNADARRAVVLATDSAAVASTLGDGILQPIDQPFAEDTGYAVDDPHYPAHDLEAAKAAAAKYEEATGQPLEFELTVFTGATNLELAQILQAQWKEAGITATINATEQAEGIKDIIFGKTQAALAANFGYPDPDFNYSFWHSSFTAPIGDLSINFPHLKDAELDATLDEGRINLVPEQRAAAYNKAVQILNDQSAYIWIYRYVAAMIAEPRVHGLREVEQNGFTTFTFKTFYPDLWMDRS